MAGTDLEEGRGRGCLNIQNALHKHKEVDTRVVQVPLHEQQAKAVEKLYKSNRTTTTKYNWITFFPKALFEQYRRVANVYFTLMAALSLTPYSPVRPWTTFLPLALVLGVAMLKEGIEDYKRYLQDLEVNKRKLQVYDRTSQQFVKQKWADVRVGDIVIVHKNENFPADLLCLTAENDEGICYIETMQLDGETNLKIRKAMDQTKHITKDTIGDFRGTVRCEPPNSRLYQFTGNLELEPPLVPTSAVVPISQGAILLRGCSLRNTNRILGLVIYAGHDTKIFMNATQPPSKRSRIEHMVDKIIYFMFTLLFAMCITGCTYFAWWTRHHAIDHWYITPDKTNVPKEYDPDSPAIVGVTNFVTAFILYGYLIPISLYVSVEMVKVVQAFVFIGQDRSMYHEDTNTPAVARTSNLNEELGMVHTILSDKTGTLTRNVMEFFKCSIAGVAYGKGITEIERANAERRGLALQVSEDADENLYREQYFNFYDNRLMDLAWAKQPNPELLLEFFRLLALCHTVIPDGPPVPEEMVYEAESPDESALVVAAKVFGFFLIKRTDISLTIRERLPEGEKDVEYELLNILEFNSTRKRMSVILRTPEGKIKLYCKGADTVIYERLDRNYPLTGEMKDVTLQHMEDFGSAGLRTLCLAYAELDDHFYEEWQHRFQEAKTSLVDREKKVTEVSEEIEKKLRLLGCTAIEDKLQEGVPQCIKKLGQAGIRLWVLTGDKMETAINIGYACSLITDEMTQFQVSGSSPEIEALEAQHKPEEATRVAAERLESQLRKVGDTIQEGHAAKRGVSYALIIDGKALLYALSPKLKDLFLEVSLRCAAVICCRVSPLQKAQVTALVKSKGDVTLAIGDGANDVGMIQKADIGVGISGQEGMQAVMASDFAIAQFRFLTPLLLVHGRLNYKRITRMITFFFYKNLVFGTTIFVYNAFTNFSGQPIYNDVYMSLFNVVFTVAAPLVVGWFDRDLDKQYGIKYPALYGEGQNNMYFNLRALLGWLATSALHACFILVMVLIGADGQVAARLDGNPWTFSQCGVLMYSIVVITVHLQLAVILDQWTWLHHVSIWLSIVVWWMFLLAFGAFPIAYSTDLYKLFSGSVADVPQYWLFLLVVPFTCVLPVFFFRAVQRQIAPAQYQIVQEIAKREARGETVEGAADGGRRPQQLHGVMAKATNLVKRRVLRQHMNGSHKRNTGFVPPYERNNHVYDADQLKAEAIAAGYNISPNGDCIVSPTGRNVAGSGLSGHALGGGYGDSVSSNPVINRLESPSATKARNLRRTRSTENSGLNIITHQPGGISFSDVLQPSSTIIARARNEVQPSGVDGCVPAVSSDHQHHHATGQNHASIHTGAGGVMGSSALPAVADGASHHAAQQHVMPGHTAAPPLLPPMPLAPHTPTSSSAPLRLNRLAAASPRAAAAVNQPSRNMLQPTALSHDHDDHEMHELYTSALGLSNNNGSGPLHR